MIKLPLIRTAVVATLAFSFAGTSFANSSHSQALELAGQKKFEQALTLLSQQDAVTRNGYEHQFLKVRILSWGGKYGEADRVLTTLMAKHPGNPDLQLAAGNLEYYQGNLPEAEAHYVAVLEKYPNYTDAQTGLANVRKAKAALENANRKWRIDGGASYSTFNVDNMPDWNNEFLRVEYTPTTIAFHGLVQRYERFGLTDIELKGGLSDAVRGGLDWGLVAGFTPGSDFRPDFSLGGNLGHSFTLESGPVLYPSVTYRYDEYDSGGIHNISPELTAYLADDLVLTGRLIGTLQDNGDDQLGWLVQGRKQVSDRVQINGGYAQAPETVNGIAISTKSVFGGLTYSVSDDFDVHVNYNRDDREDVYVRNSLNVGFTHKR